MIHIRMANESDIPSLMRFIHDNWKKEHIYAISEEYFRYEFLVKNSLHFVIGEDETGICAIHGYIVSNFSDSPAIFPVMWKSIKYLGLGMSVHKYLINFVKPALVFGAGINPATSMPLYKRLGEEVGKMNHFYRLNENFIDFKIASIKNRIIPQIEETEHKLVLVKSAEDFIKMFDVEKYSKRKPYKDFAFIKHRYFEHPIYSYKIYGIKHSNKIESVIFLREVKANSSKILRIIDFIGNELDLSYVSFELNSLICEGNYEYMDVYCHGISNSVFERMGFVERIEDDVNIIPNYFEPFIQKNVEIYYHSSQPDVYIFKGDGDQDRPSII